MKKILLNILKVLIPVGLGVFLVVHIYGQLDDEQRKVLFSSMREANYGWVMLSIIMGILSHIIRGYRWRFQFETMDIHVRPLNSFLAVMIGYIVNMALPRVGEISRAAALSRAEKIPFQNSFGTILSERAIDLVVLLIITASTIALQYQILAPYGITLYGIWLGIINSAAIWVIFGLLVCLLILVIFIIRKYHHHPGVQSLKNLVTGLWDGIISVFKMPRRRAYLLCTLGIWLLYIGMFWVCFLALPVTASLSIRAVMAGFVVGSFAIVLIPGGIGAFPVGIMECVALYGIPAESGFALGWILWLSQTAMILVIGSFSLFYFPIYNKNYVRTATVPH